MKTITFYLSIVLVSVLSCVAKPTNSSVNITPLLDSKNFTFMAQRVNINNADVANVLNSMPNSSYARAQDLSYGYSIIFKNNEMEITLPYFGRTYNPSYDTSKNSFRFTSKDFSMTKTVGKNGNDNFKIKTNDLQPSKTIYMEIYKSGKAYVTIDSNDRQPISYDGYIMKNEGN